MDSLKEDMAKGTKGAAVSYEGRERRGGGCLPVLGNFFLMLFGGLLLLGVVVMAGLWRSGDRFLEGLDTMFNPPQPTPTVDIRSVVVRQIRDASELTTTVFAMETVADASQVRTLAGFEIGTTRLLYIGYGEVRAGVDLSEIEREDVEVISDTIRIRLPAPRILDSKIDVNRSRVYDYDKGFLSLGPDAPELQSAAEQDALSKVVAGACESGILDEANEKAQVAVTQLLNVAGYREVIVDTRPPAPEACGIP